MWKLLKVCMFLYICYTTIRKTFKCAKNVAICAANIFGSVARSKSPVSSEQEVAQQVEILCGCRTETGGDVHIVLLHSLTFESFDCITYSKSQLFSLIVFKNYF